MLYRFVGTFEFPANPCGTLTQTGDAEGATEEEALANWLARLPDMKNKRLMSFQSFVTVEAK